MCDQAMLGNLSLGMQGAGVVASTYGAYSKASADRTAYNYQAAVAENNQQFATWQAADAIKRGQTAVMAHQLKTASLKASQRASLAAKGVDLGEGSPLDILTTTDVMGAVDANTLADNATKEAWAYRNQAANYGANADLLRMRADSSNPLMAAGGTLLTGAGAVASNWYMMKSKGVPGVARG